MALPQNRKAVDEILRILTPKVVGKHHSGFSCSCGAIHCSPGTAVAIRPAGNEYPGQEVFYYLWSVDIRYHPENPQNHSGFSVGVTEFIDHDEVTSLFDKYFGTNPQMPKTDYVYRLISEGEKRFYNGLGLAVKISEGPDHVAFYFDWGINQEVAEWIKKFEKRVEKVRLPKTSPDFSVLLDYLRNLKPYVYSGGPAPELPDEYLWHLDYQKALLIAEESANHLFTRTPGSFHDYRGSVLTSGEVRFMKVQIE